MSCSYEYLYNYNFLTIKITCLSNQSRICFICWKKHLAITGPGPLSKIKKKKKKITCKPIIWLHTSFTQKGLCLSIPASIHTQILRQSCCSMTHCMKTSTTQRCWGAETTTVFLTCLVLTVTTLQPTEVGREALDA